MNLHLSSLPDSWPKLKLRVVSWLGISPASPFACLAPALHSTTNKLWLSKIPQSHCSNMLSQEAAVRNGPRLTGCMYVKAKLSRCYEIV